MGLMKKAVRRATPRSVRRVNAVVKHPVGTAVNAATPRSVRKAKRTAFNIAHPVNTAENVTLNAVTPKGSRHRSMNRLRPRSSTFQSQSRGDSGVETVGGTHFRRASGKDERVLVVIVSAGDRRDVLATRMRQTQIFGEWELPAASQSHRQIRRGLRRSPYFLLADAPAELGQRIATAYAGIGARVELWVPVEADTHEAVRDDGVNAESIPARITQAWLDREVPNMSPGSFERLLDLLATRGWGSEEIEHRVMPLRPSASR